MALKSYRLKLKKGKRKKSKSIGRLLVGGATALIGVALLSETAKAVSRV
ncbi:hypothetical protein LCGC14_0546140 [marine sediment metagenome]|uniref:Uncharacterized protein n=1 Tax=marine sediment metagenome TaxID=412755 RepID=A0A0F9RW74_9ZZZZ